MDTVLPPLDTMLDAPLFAPLPSVDDLWGDDFFQLLRDTDMAMEDELPTLPCLEGSPGGSSAESSGSAAAGVAAPASGPQHSQPAQQQPQILLASAVCKRRPLSPAPGQPMPQGLPALSGATSSHGAAAGLWRTVTTAATPGANTAAPEQQQLNPAISVPAAIAAFDLTKLPSLPVPAMHLKSCSSSESPCLPSVLAAAPQPPAASGLAKPSRASQRYKKQVTFTAEDPMSEDDSEDSIDTEEDGLHSNSAGSNPDGRIKANKRKAPEVDWRSIEDPAERRRQRRLAKNRVTAARSRERKKTQWVEMEEKLNAMEAQNQSLREMLEAISAENTTLRQQLAALSGQGTAAPPGATGSGHVVAKGNSHGEPAALVLIATLLLLCAFLPNNSESQMSVALGGVAPLALLAALLSMSSSSRSWRSGRAKGSRAAIAAAVALQLQHQEQDAQQRATKRRATTSTTAAAAKHSSNHASRAAGCSSDGVLFMQVYAFVMMLLGRVQSRVVQCLPSLKHRLRKAVVTGGGVVACARVRATAVHQAMIVSCAS